MAAVPVPGGSGGKPSAPLVVTITGAAGNIGYALAFMLAQGRALGSAQTLQLNLLVR